jgi:cytochrome c oxidase cbb3-type subunit III
MRTALALSVCAWLAAMGCAHRAPAAPPSAAPPGQTTGTARRPASSPASPPRPAIKPQTYAPEQVQAGQTQFVAQCGFCHGRDAQGGETGPDLTRSTLVAEDVRGNKIGPVVRSGRPDKGMPPFPVSDADLAALVAFIHDATAKAATLAGGRRSVAVEDLQTGNAEAGRRYFEGPGKCITCHPIAAEFATIGSRYQGLALLQRMLYPGSGGREGGPAPARPTATVTTKAGEQFTGRVAHRDEFTIAIVDASGWTRSWATSQVTVTIDDPLRAHREQLAKYTDDDMHDVFAYLQTLR